MGKKRLYEIVSTGRTDPCAICPNAKKCGDELMACEGYFMYAGSGKTQSKRRKWEDKKLRLVPVSWQPSYEYFVQVFTGGNDYLERPNLDYYEWSRGKEKGWFSVDKGSHHDIPAIFKPVKCSKAVQVRRNTVNSKNRSAA